MEAVRMIKAIVFDVDDTLYDQAHPFEQALLSVFEPNDLRLPNLREIFNQFHSQATIEAINTKKISTEKILTAKLNATLESLALPTFSPAELAKFWKSYSSQLHEIHLFPEFVHLFDQLERFFKLGIITNGSVERQLSKITQLKMFNWIDRENVLISEECQMAKPDPLIFTTMNRKLEVSPSEIAYVGNRYDLDVRGAKKAGWHAFWFNHRDLEESNGDIVADQTVSNSEELIELLEALVTIAE
ncbi:HAD family hydrolase [Secundilactobacillus malefermentans]|nr:HAD family hydrolase [Secundilactobacillus malefermentans]